MRVALNFGPADFIRPRPEMAEPAKAKKGGSSHDGSSQAKKWIYTVPWYPNEYPEKRETVRVRLTRVDEMGIFCQLLEYGSKDGMIPLGQYSTKRTRRIPKNLREGKKDIAIVSAVDEEQANLDLTRQGLRDTDTAAAKQRFTEMKKLMELLAFIAQDQSIAYPELVAAVAHELHRRHGNAFRALQASHANRKIIDDLDISDVVKEKLLAEVNKSFAPRDLQIHAVFEAELLIGAVDDLRAALVSGYDVDVQGGKLNLQVIAPPLYAANLLISDQKPGKAILQAVLDKIEASLKAVRGRFAIKEAAQVMNEDEVKKALERLAFHTEKDESSGLEDGEDE